MPGRVVIPGSAGVPPAQDLAGSWRLASQGWSVHLPTGAGAAPLQECGRDARAPRGKPMAGQVQIRILQKALLDRYFSSFLEIVSPFPTLGGSLLSLLQPLSGPSPFFVPLRGYLFAFSWKSFLPFPTLGGSLLSLLQPLSGPSCSSWITLFPFVLFVDPLRGYLFSLLVGLRHGLASAQQLTRMSSPSILTG